MKSIVADLAGAAILLLYIGFTLGMVLKAFHLI